MRNILGSLLGSFKKSDTKQPNQSGRYSEEALAFLSAFGASGLFDPTWYLSLYPDLAAANVNPVEHYFAAGWREGRKPNPVFDPAWYLERNADVAASGMNPLLHYWQYGEKENRRPSPHFDTAWYRERYKTDIGDRSALGHYLKNGRANLFSPHRHFDPAYYLAQNADVSQANADPFEHYVTNGFREGRNPSARFNTVFYIRSHMHGDQRDPLWHYLDVGLTASLPTTPEEAPRTCASEIRRNTSKGSEFEEFNPIAAVSETRRAKLIAFYLPQFHTFPENNSWWGTGFTEWTNVARATPRFEGHYQPRIPRDLGFYDLSNVETIRNQVALAEGAGVHGFCFYYYNFNGKRLLDKPVELLLKSKDINFPFCIMWANENWTRRWDGAESEVLIRQDYKTEDVEDLIGDFARHFADTRYIRIDGRPLLILYRPDIVPNTRETLKLWRKTFERLHNESPLILMAQGFGNIDPTLDGFDGAIEFPPHKLAENATPTNAARRYFDHASTAPVFSYDEIVQRSLGEARPHYPLIKTVFPGWDNDARRQGNGMIIADSSPQKFERWIDRAIEFAESHKFHNEKLVFVNAWNEWAEGAYLEPDLHYGSAYLNATARAVTGATTSSPRMKLILVGHDAHRHGAQLLLLNLAKQIRRTFGIETTVLLCGGGDMEADYSQVTSLKVCSSEKQAQLEIENLRLLGYECAITNTVATGHLAPLLRQAGFRTISLVHELPRIIKELALATNATALANSCDVLVFPSNFVKSRFLENHGECKAKAVVRPQGIYHGIERISGARDQLREEFQLPSTAKIVVNIGFGDLRKGVDLFCRIAQIVQKSSSDTYFIWVGNLDHSIRTWFGDEKALQNVVFAGQRVDVDRFLSAADAFALTSREDPFPSVVLEALSIGIPVVAFKDAGGFVDVLDNNPLGHLVDYGSIDEFANELIGILASPPNAAVSSQVASQVRSDFQFDEYAHSLVRAAAPSVRKVSVVVPNFNYARYLPSRLASIFNQTHPIFELIILDDASTDESERVISEVAASFARNVVVVRNDTNTGSPYAQWERGARMARGDLIWIAEADDLADPAFLSATTRGFDADEIAIAYTDSTPIDEDGNELSRDYKDYYSKIFSGALSSDATYSGKEFASTFLSQRNAILNVSSVLWRRDAILSAFEHAKEEMKTLKLAADWLLYLNACKSGAVRYYSRPMNKHRRHIKGVTSGTKSEVQLREVLAIHKSVRRDFDDSLEVRNAQRAYIEELEAQFGVRAEQT